MRENPESALKNISRVSGAPAFGRLFAIVACPKPDIYREAGPRNASNRPRRPFPAADSEPRPIEKRPFNSGIDPLEVNRRSLKFSPYEALFAMRESDAGGRGPLHTLRLAGQEYRFGSATA